MTKQEALVHREVGEAILQRAATHLMRGNLGDVSDIDAIAIMYSCQCLVELTEKRENSLYAEIINYKDGDFDV